MIINDCSFSIDNFSSFSIDNTNFSSNKNEVIRRVLNFLSFFYDKISQVQKSIKTQF